MKYKIAKEFPDDIIFEEAYPCISLYQPTHRYSPDNKKDPILYKDLLRNIEGILVERNRKNDIDNLMEPFYKIGQDKDFWNNTLDGMAVLANPHKCIVYRLNIPVNELSVVSDSFHIKPLIRFYQSMDRFQLLGLSQNDFTLYEGNRYGVDSIELDPGTPVTMKEVLGEEHPGSYTTHGTYGKADGAAMYHGHGGKKDAMETDIERFFRYVDRFVLDNYSKISGLPLVLAALDKHHGLFRKISRNPYLVPEGIRGSYKSLKRSEIAGKAWKVMEPFYLEKIQDLVDDFQDKRASLLGSQDLKQVSLAAVEGRVDTVLIDGEKMIPGRIDNTTGDIGFGNIKDPELDDILDDLAELVMRKKGQVVVLPKDKMPYKTGIAAIYRY